MNVADISGNAAQTVSAEAISCHPLSTHLTMTMALAKAPHGGEDATPYAGPTKISVCDGLGGSGAVKYPHIGTIRGVDAESASAETRSGAHVASRLVQSIAGTEENIGSRSDVASLLVSIEELLTGADVTAGSPRSGLRSKNLLPLPTTLALASIQPNLGDVSMSAHVVTAGDSRVYLLDPSYGLQQLSRDHLDRHTDALSAIRDSGKMSNCISLEKDWYLDVRVFDTFKPGQLLFSCSDGCFDYLLSPMHFEHLMLATLIESNSINEWSNRLEDYFRAYSQDDSTLALISYGTESFEEVQRDFVGRFDHIRNVIDKLEPSSVGLRPDGWDEALESEWLRYEPGYNGRKPSSEYTMNLEEAREILHRRQQGTVR